MVGQHEETFTRPLLFIVLTCVCILVTQVKSITIVHHDKHEIMQLKLPNESNNSLPIAERQKRLLPYINYYRGNKNDVEESRNYYLGQLEDQLTPFLESNALPGKFIPIRGDATQHTNNNNNYRPVPSKTITTEYFQASNFHPNYGNIYDKLAHIQIVSGVRPQFRPITRKNKYFNNNGRLQSSYKLITRPDSNMHVHQAPATVETYKPKNIDITITEHQRPQIPAPASPYYHTDRPNKPTELVTVQLQQPHTLAKPMFQKKQQTPTILLLSDKLHYQSPISSTKSPPPKSIIYLIPAARPPTPYQTLAQIANALYTPATPQPSTSYNPQSYNPKYYEYIHEQYETTTPRTKSTPNYSSMHYTPTAAYPTKSTLNPQTIYNTESDKTSDNQLATLLQHLQKTNTLPHTFTTENIDNSIRTLVAILESLKRKSLFRQPIVVAEENEDYDNIPIEHVQDDSVLETYPMNTIDGGTPGTPGIDYPALSSIPPTSFDCKKQRYKGFFGDPHTNCQVWHYCDLNGGQASFLCPNGTIFSQVALTCDWWYNVKCSSTAQLYVLNERLYKYVIPLVPKFPEDYSGPLVDKYLAMKFQEMEDKMAREKKGKGEQNDQMAEVSESEISAPATEEAPPVTVDDHTHPTENAASE